MKKINIICLMLVWIVNHGKVSAQTTDTLGLTGTAMDTTVAIRLFAEMKTLIKERKLEAAEMKGGLAREIFERVQGEEVHLADTWEQLGEIKLSKNDFQSAISCHSNALTIRLRYPENGVDRIVRSFNYLGLCYQQSEDFEKAADNYKKAIATGEKTLGKNHLILAFSYVGLSKLLGIDEGIKYVNQALDIYINQNPPDSLNMISCYSSLANLSEDAGLYEKSIEYGEKALDIAFKVTGPNSQGVASIYNNLANVLMGLGQYDKALDYNLKALNIRLQILEPDHPKVGSSYYGIGTYYKETGNYEESIRYYNKALSIWLQTLGPLSSNVAGVYSNLGVCYSNRGDYAIAIDFYNRALGVYFQIYGPIHADIGSVYNNMGVVYSKIGNNDEAMSCYKKSLGINTSLYGLEHPFLISDYTNIGVIYSKEGEYNLALQYFNKSLSLILKFVEPEHPDVGLIYGNIGIAYEHMSDYDKSIMFQENSLKIAIQAKGSEHPLVADGYGNLATSYLSKGDVKQAINYTEKSIEIYRKNFGAKYPGLSISYNNLGNAYDQLEMFESAISQYKKALDIDTSLFASNSAAAVSSYYNMANTYLRAQKPEEALYYYDQAMKSLNYSPDKPNLVKSLDLLIKCCQSLSKLYLYKYNKSHSPAFLSLSHDYAGQAIKTLDYQQSTFSEESTKAFWQDRNYSIYEQAISVIILKADEDKNDSLKCNAFSYAEKSKAGQLRAQARGAEAASFAGVPDSLLQHEKNLGIDITWREKQRQSLLDKGLAETDTNILRISGIIFDLKQKQDTLRKTFKTRFPDYYRLKYDLSTVSLSCIQDTLLQQGQTLLEYFVGDSAVYVFTVRPDTFVVTEIKKNFPLEEWVQHMRHGLYAYYQSGSANPVYYDSTASEYASAAYWLYAKLIGPVADLLTDQVIVVPDGALGYVPFEALLTKLPAVPRRFYNHSYFGKDRRISYAYSGTLLREMQGKQHKVQPTRTLLAFAPFSRDDVKVLREQLDTLSELVELRSDTLSTLTNSGREALVAEKIFNGRALLGTSASRDSFQYLAERYGILHLSTHGKANDKVGDYAYLAFGLTGNSSGFEKLYVKDIYNLSLKADLVVLSACETGIGQLQRGEGIISLARAFAYAGAKSIVTTLWQVDDARTSRLMLGFYNNLRKGMSKDEALWRVKREKFMESKKDAHPFFWAGFIPVGDMAPLKY